MDALRKTLGAAGLYGDRVAVHVGAPGSFPLPPGVIAPKGTLRLGGVPYAYTSIVGQRYPQIERRALN